MPGKCSSRIVALFLLEFLENLCAEGSHEQIELLRLGESSIRVEEYLTELPSKEMLVEKLHSTISQTKRIFDLSKDEKHSKIN